MRHWGTSSTPHSATVPTPTRARNSIKSPRSAPSPLSPIMTSSMMMISSSSSVSSAAAALLETTSSDDLATSFSSEWPHSSTSLYPFQLYPHLQQLQIQSPDSSHFQQQQQQQRVSVITGAASAMEFHCPICLRVTAQAPIRQHCGHALCSHCTHQAMSKIGSCPLCPTQLLFEVAASGNSQGLQVGANMSTGGSLGSAMDLGFAAASEREATNRAAVAQTRIALQPQAFGASPPSVPAPSLASASDFTRELAASPVRFDASGATRELHSDSELSLQLDSLSDFGDMIDLPDFVASSDSEIVRHPVAAAGSAAVGLVSVRKARVPRKKAASSAPVVRSASEPPTRTATRNGSSSSSASTGAISKKRKRKTPELVDASWAWTLVDAVGEQPSPRYDCGFAMYGSTLLVVGGIVSNQRLNDLHILDTSVQAPTRPNWIKPQCSGSPPPTGSLLQTFVIEATLYVIGGTSDGKFLNELHAMDLRSGKYEWQRLTVAGTPPSMRYWYSVTVLDGVAILYGGYGHPKRLGDTFALRLDLDVPTWMELQPQGDLPGPSSTHSVCVHNRRMYIFGGYDGKARRSQLHALQIVSKTRDAIACAWELVATLGRAPTPRYTHSSVCIGSRMLVYGGNSGCLKGDLHVLEFDSAELPTWKVVKCEHAPPPREWHRALALHGAMFVFGGHTADGNESALYRLAARLEP